jgi:glycosyltransferase involved in cell wall biosynthesis
LKILYLSYQDDDGGAFIGAKRLHHALQKENIQSSLLVRRKLSDDPSVIQYKVQATKTQERFNEWIVKKQAEFKKQFDGPTSFNLRHTGVHRIINQSNADCVIIHWVGKDTISIKEIAKIKKPIIWRLADMWAFSGCQHYSEESLSELEMQFGNTANKIDQLVWKRKKKYWEPKRFNVVCGSEWLSRKAKASSLFRDAKVTTIPSSLDTNIFKSSKTEKQRSKPTGTCKILFGAQNAFSDKRKGFDLLIDSLLHLRNVNPDLNIRLKVFGNPSQEIKYFRSIKTESLGVIEAESEMAKLYNWADLFAIPSRADNLPFTAMESLSCGTPVVGFAVGGIPEIIDHKKSGFLAKPFDCTDFADGIYWIYNLESIARKNICQNARKKALDQYSLKAQATSYIKLIKSLI